MKPAGRGESLQPESGSLPLYLIWIGSGSCRAVAYLLTRGVSVYAWYHNSFSWACSSAVHSCLVKAFEVETRGDPVRFNGKSNARLRSAVLVTCVHFTVLFIWGQLSAVFHYLAPSHTHTHSLHSFDNLNGFSLCPRLRREEEKTEI